MAASGTPVSAGLPAPYAAVAVGGAELREVLAASGIFGPAAGAPPMREEVLRDIEAELATVMVRGGETVVREGDPSDDLLIVVSGLLRAVRERRDGGGGEPVLLAELGRGEIVGEIGIITGDPRAATVYAVRDSILARLSRQSFESLLRRHPGAMVERFAGTTLRRLVRQLRGEQPPHRRPAAFSGSIALVAADPRVPLDAVAARLKRGLDREGTALLVNPAACDAVLGRAGASAEALGVEDEARLALWLGAEERRHRFMLYLAGDAATPWGARCLRQADHVVVVARAGADPEPRTVAALQGGDGAGARRTTSLVLLHDSASVGAGALERWRGVTAAPHAYHVRIGEEGDYARVARLLAGSAVALVIGGGGARAFAAVGVVRALHETGADVDVVAGVSAGAVVAALVAMGLDHDRLMARCLRAANRIDYTFPVHALTTGRNWSATLAALFGDTRIEDLLLPYFCTSVNLSAARLIVHDRGPLLHAVRASTAIPGILPPVWDEGSLLVDGGLMNNLPVDLARARRGVGRVLAVAVGAGKERRPRERFGYSVNGWTALWRWVTGRRGADIPTTASLLMQAMLVADAQTTSRTTWLADRVFRPPMRGFSLMDWHRIAEAADAGYRYALEVLRKAEGRG